MGREVSGSKGFFLAVIVLLALAIFVSYWGDSTAGQAIRSQGPGNQEPRCTTNFKEPCGFSPIDPIEVFANHEEDAIKQSKAKCDTQIEAKVTDMNNCILLNRAKCPVPCRFSEEDRKSTVGPCKIDSCIYTIRVYNRPDYYYVVCTYQYDLDGKKIEPGDCNMVKDTGQRTPQGWKCTASDGAASSTAVCKP